MSYYKIKKCKKCGEDFYPVHARQVRCFNCNPKVGKSCRVFFIECVQCGKYFTSMTGNGLYCSKKCKNDFMWLKNHTTCKWCKGPNKRPNSLYCCDYCADLSISLGRCRQLMVDFGHTPLEWPGPDYRNAQHAPII